MSENQNKIVNNQVIMNFPSSAFVCYPRQGELIPKTLFFEFSLTSSEMFPPMHILMCLSTCGESIWASLTPLSFIPGIIDLNLILSFLSQTKRAAFFNNAWAVLRSLANHGLK